jgi:hypothetical protein
LAKKENLCRDNENIFSCQFIQAESAAINLNHASVTTTAAGTEKLHLRSGQYTKICHFGTVFSVATDLTDFNSAAPATFRQRACIRRTLHSFELAVFAVAMQAMAGYVGMISGHVAPYTI